VQVAPGIDPSLIPSWFSNLSVTVEGATRGVDATLTVAAAPVPEPGSVLVFLAAAGGGLVALRRRRD